MWQNKLEQKDWLYTLQIIYIVSSVQLFCEHTLYDL